VSNPSNGTRDPQRNSAPLKKKMDFLRKVSLNFSSVLYLAALALFVIGLIVAFTISGTDTAQEKGDKRIVASVFILVPIIIVQFVWTTRNCNTKVFNDVLKTF